MYICECMISVYRSGKIKTDYYSPCNIINAYSAVGSIKSLYNYFCNSHRDNCYDHTCMKCMQEAPKSRETRY